MKITFIVGTGRCDSTLLHEIKAKHKDVGFFTNFEEKHQRLGMLGKWGSIFYRIDHRIFTRSWQNRFAPTEGYRLLAREISPIYVRPCRDLGASDVSPWMKKQFYNYFLKSYAKYGKPILATIIPDGRGLTFFYNFSRSKIYPYS